VIAALIFVVSFAAFGQFAFIYLRALMVSVASQALSPQIQEAAGVTGRALRGDDFAKVFNLHEICPQFVGSSGGLRRVSAYYRLVAMFSRSGELNLSGWAQQELATCARYAAVTLDQRIAANCAAAAQLRSF
jgi:hypothetical protein